MLRKTLIAVALGSALIIAAPLSAQATPSDSLGTWYAMDWDIRPSLYEINQDTGAATLIGTSTLDLEENGNNEGMAGMDVDATNGVGYFIPYASNAHVWSVSLSTGVFTQGPATAADHVTAFDIGNNGEIWVAADDLAGTQWGFGRINKDTGAVTVLATPPNRIAALATSPDGVLYAFDYNSHAYTVNTSTYVFTDLGETNASPRAADFDVSGRLILQSWGGELSSFDLTTNTQTSLFTINGITYEGFEAFGVGGPTNGQTLEEAINGPTERTVTPTLADTGFNASGVWFAVGAIVLGGTALTVVRVRRARKQ